MHEFPFRSDTVEKSYGSFDGRDMPSTISERRHMSLQKQWNLASEAESWSMCTLLGLEALCPQSCDHWSYGGAVGDFSTF